jgi:hypothetical protein
VQVGFDGVFGVVRSGSGFVAGGGWFDPEVAWVVGVTAELQADQVVVFGVVERAGVAIGAGVGAFLLVGDTDRGRIPPV